MKSFTGCWTCRLRRKKCDEGQPVCAACATLLITCHYSNVRPSWMDGGEKQAGMAEQVKSEIKARAPFRLRTSAPLAPDTKSSEDQSSTEHEADTTRSRMDGNGCHPQTSMSIRMRTSIDSGCWHANKFAGGKPSVSRSDMVLISHFLDYVFPFIFPFYRPPASQGGKSWMLELALASPVLGQAAMCQASFFLSLAQVSSGQAATWDAMLMQTTEVFGTVRLALQVFIDSKVSQHLPGAARILACIMHWQHFEVAMVGFDHWQTHLSAAVGLFEEIMNSVSQNEQHIFTAVLSCLGDSTSIPSVNGFQVPNPEQAAFRFAASLVLYEDVIAGTVLGNAPKLAAYHGPLLTVSDDGEPALRMDDVVSCPNRVVLYLGKIASLQAQMKTWKCDDAAKINLKDDFEAIAHEIDSGLFEISDEWRPEQDSLDAFFQQSGMEDTHASYVKGQRRPSLASIWACAARLYLALIRNRQNWNADIAHRSASKILDLFEAQIKHPAVIRSVLWPLCVAGFVADATLEHRFRDMVQNLQPTNIFGSARQALHLMERVWNQRGADGLAPGSLPEWFRHEDSTFLFV